MGYIVESYRESDKVLRKLHEAKMALCEAVEALEGEPEMMERRNYRDYRNMRDYRNYRDYRDRYDY